MSTESPSIDTPRTLPTAASAPERRLALVALGAAGAATLAIVTAGLLDTGYSARSEAISALASLESGSAGIMTVGFVLMAVTLLAAGSVLARRLAGKAARTGSALVVIAGALTVVVGFARQDCSTLQQSCLARESAGTVSGEHVVHNLASLVLFLALVAGTFLLASGLRRSALPLGLARTARVAAFLSVALLVWFGSGAYGTNGGLVQRAFILVAYGVPVWLALRVTRPDAAGHDH